MILDCASDLMSRYSLSSAVDGITGGFNFQNAWATGYIAGEAMAMC